MTLNAIVWDVSPEIFDAGIVQLRWYGLLFVSGFMIGQKLMEKMYREAGKSREDLDVMLIYMIAAVLLGARLGHCFFYQPDYYLAHPEEIFQVWKGGLASHGAAAGILLALYIYSHFRKDQPYLWVLDRIVICVALGGAFIRIGNLMNSEIVGLPTDVPWGFIFVQNGENFARHPSQLYESLFYFFTFFVLYRTYLITKEKTPQGKIFGMFLVMLFGFRFVIEFMKENQTDFEAGMALNMGQILSIPLILAGLYVSFQASKGNFGHEAPQKTQ